MSQETEASRIRHLRCITNRKVLAAAFCVLALVCAVGANISRPHNHICPPGLSPAYDRNYNDVICLSNSTTPNGQQEWLRVGADNHVPVHVDYADYTAWLNEYQDVADDTTNSKD